MGIIKAKLRSFFKKNLKIIIPFAVVSFVGCAILTFRFSRRLAKDLDVTLTASVKKGGEYEHFLAAFAHVLNEDSSRYKVKLNVCNSQGASGTTIDQLDKGKADIGLVQSNAKWNSKNISAVAYVYSELYFLITNRKDLASISDIANCRDTLTIARLDPPSQTSKDLLNLISFYGIDASRIRYIDKDYNGTYAMLKSGKADLGFMIVGLGNEVISSVLKDPTLHLVAFENTDAYVLRRHKLNKFILPMGFYGLHRPDSNYETFATRAMLVVSSNLSDRTVYKFTRALFEKESELVNEYPFCQLQKIRNDGETYIPVHKAVLQYYNRDHPSFLDRNTNLIATVLSIIGLVLSAIPIYIEFAGRRRRISLRPAHI
ncbi:hypothetical protein HHL17_16355 [Chitinophaga sp. G-6-1-13]|uniref:TAXI family TRAP transporter solute-binding subunit n=1 Tax=Chitinophaga fulva TaxID=2728842 RepID=A0A848GMD9_9BACT|nr:TAXI family TRAP transporter solute-binding subunit [Chitinophaga fulva]NML38781.1 hypothetical protein [Chitinophaga fulva]